MPKIHIVGERNSFTFNACNNRYPNGYDFESHSHADLIANLLRKQILRSDASIVPLWNSNVGTVDMDRKTMTTEIFLGQAGNIVDLWPEEIVFGLGVSGGGKLSKNCDIFSVHVASNQCSQFLNSVNVYGTERFKGENTTTDAAISFQDLAKTGDGLLGSKNLLAANKLVSNKNFANPYNFTMFSTINSLPKPRERGNQIYSLACILADLNGDKLPVDFVSYWQQLFSEHEAEESTNILDEIPKIMFIIRHNEGKALLLLEMASNDFTENPWPATDIDVDHALERRSELVSCEQVGGIYESYVATERTLFLNSFTRNENDIIFYGLGSTFLWGSPALNVFVHGFDPSLVKECARLQINRLVQLMNYGIPMPATAEELLKSFETDEGSLKLSIDSLPDFAQND